ncbi:MAG: hypothetical protein GZ087_05070 [Flavobacterium sp.]|nr:hypothetical protein [Flavobacterium sp.]
MKTGKILIAAIVGTSAMTLFSYLVSSSENKNFREPEVLGQLIKRLPKSRSKKSSQIAGWLLHYTIGISFVTFYHQLWKRKKINPSLASGAGLGAASGLVGVTGWKGMFEFHPKPPAKNLKPFFGHLILAHVVFGVFSALSYKVAQDHKIRELK